MRTPGHDQELAAGFLLSEGIIRASDEIDKFSRPSGARNRENIITVTLAEGIKPKLKLNAAFRHDFIELRHLRERKHRGDPAEFPAD